MRLREHHWYGLAAGVGASLVGCVMPFWRQLAIAAFAALFAMVIAHPGRSAGHAPRSDPK